MKERFLALRLITLSLLATSLLSVLGWSWFGWRGAVVAACLSVFLWLVHLVTAAKVVRNALKPLEAASPALAFSVERSGLVNRTAVRLWLSRAPGGGIWVFRSLFGPPELVLSLLLIESLSEEELRGVVSIALSQARSSRTAWATWAAALRIQLSAIETRLLRRKSPESLAALAALLPLDFLLSVEALAASQQIGPTAAKIKSLPLPKSRDSLAALDPLRPLT